MKNSGLLIGSLIGIAVGTVTGILGVYAFDPKWGFNFWGFPTVYGAYGGAILGTFGGLIAGLVARKFGGIKITLLLSIMLGACFGVVGGIVLSSLVFVFSQ
jgi:hypothetical protein